MNREQRIRGLNFPWKIFAVERRNEANRARPRKKGSGEERKCSTTLPFDPSRKLFTFDETGGSIIAKNRGGGRRNGGR